MATTFVEYTGDGNATKQFTFPSYQESDVKVRVDDVLKTSSTHYNITSYTTTGGGNVVFTSGNIPSSGTIRIYRDTNVDVAKTTFTAGSSIRAEDLNNNQTQLLYRSQEEQIPNLIHSYDVDDSAITTAKIAADAIDGTKIADDSINSEHYVDGSIDTAHIADSQVTTVKIANDAVNNDKLADNSVNTAQLIDSAVSTNKIADTAVTTAKIADDAVTADKLANSINTAIASNTSKTSNATHTGEVTGATALTIANGAVVADRLATDSVTTAKIVNANVTHAKLANDAVDGDNIADDSINSEHYVDGSIDTAHIADAQITTAKIADGAITDAKIAGGSLDNRYYTETELDAGQLDNRYYTEAESDARYFNISTGDTIKDGDTFPDNDTTIATTAAINDRIIDLIDDVGGFVPIANETSFPTANPDVNNGAGTIVSVKAASTGLTAQSGTTLTISNGAGTGNTVTITGLSVTIPSGFGFLVETTTTLHTYTFHRLIPKATEVSTVAGSISNVNTVAGSISNVNSVASNATNINTVGGAITNVNNVGGSIANVNTVASNLSSVNSFANVYRVGSSNPTTSLDVGDLFFNTTSDSLKVYTGSAWVDGVTATGNFAVVTGNTFTGSNSHNDNVKSIYGTGGDLEIYHSGNGSFIKDGGTGPLTVLTNHLLVRNAANNEELLEASENGAVELYHDGTKKFETTSGGVDVAGNITVSGTVDGVDIAALNTTVGNISTDVVSDTSPQLGGDLDVQAQQITTSTTNGNIKLTPNGTGVIEVKGAGGADGTLQLNCSANSHGVKIKSPPHSAAASYTLTLPDTDGSANQVLKTDGSGNLDWVNQTTDTNTQLSTEQVQDIAGPLVATGGTKTGITVTYDDANGNMDFVVASQTDENFTTADHSKLDGIEAGATADQTASEIRTLVESASDSNVFTDADHSKLDGIEASATADQTASEIRTLVESASDSNVFTDADHSKLDGIEASATADQTASEIRTLVESASDSNVFTDADHTKLNGIASSANNYSHPNHSGEVTSSGDGAMTIADNVVDEANLKISNSPQDGYMLTAQSGNTGGLTWAPAAAGATGASNDEIFWENGTNVTADYTITNGKNAGSFGPITIDSGVTVTVGSGETWTVV